MSLYMKKNAGLKLISEMVGKLLHREEPLYEK